MDAKQVKYQKLVCSVEFTLEQPLCQIAFAGKEGKKEKGESENIKLALAVDIGEGAKAVRQVPIISGNTIRNAIRDNLARVLTSGVPDGDAGYHDTFAQFSGGTLDGKTPADKAAVYNGISTWQQKNPLIHLMGAAHPFTGIIEGNIFVADGVPALKGLQAYTGVEGSVALNDVFCKRTYVRKDTLSRDPEVFALLSDEGVEALANADANVKKKKATKNGDGDDTNASADSSDTADASSVESASSRQMPYTISYLPAGIQVVSSIVVLAPTALMTGALVAALRRFAEVPILGGLRAKGYGLISANIDVSGVEHDHAYVNLGSITIRDYISIARSKGSDAAFTLKCATGYLSDAIKQFDAYVAGITQAEQLSCPPIAGADKPAPVKKSKKAAEVAV